MLHPLIARQQQWLGVADIMKAEAHEAADAALDKYAARAQKIAGITSYAWAAKADVMLVPLGGDLFVRRADGGVQRLTDTAEPELDPQLCPSGERVAFARAICAASWSVAVCAVVAMVICSSSSP